MTIDVFEQAVASRPNDDAAERLWPADRRDAALASITTGERTPRPPRADRRRWVASAVAAGVVAVALIGGSVVLPSDGPAGPSPAVAAVIDRLAVTAGAAPADSMRPGQYWHGVERTTQRYSDGGTEQITKQSWRGTDGSVWRRDSGSGRTHTFLFPAEGTPSLNAPTPALLATFPTDRTELQKFIDDEYAGLFGSEQDEERVLIAVGDMLRQGFAPPALRAAALGVLAQQPGVRVLEGVTDDAGRTVTAVGFVEGTLGEPGSSESYLLIDPATSRIVGERGSFVPLDPPRPGIQVPVSYSTVTLDGAVVDSVPANIRRTAVDQSRSVDTACSVNGTC